MPNIDAKAGISLIEMPVKRRVIVVRLFIVVLVLLALLLFFGVWKRDDFSMYFFIPISVITFVYISSPLASSLISGVALVITDQGLVDRLGSFGFISWAEILGAHKDRMIGNELIALELTNQEAVVDRQPVVRRLLLRYHLRKNPYAFFLKPDFIQGDSEALIQMIHDRARGSDNASTV